MKYKVSIAISNRHVHLNKETYDLLFDSELTKKKDLNQIGQFAANETVDIINGDYVIENVRIVGPLRPYNQVEISASDARKLKLTPPVRTSGDLDGSLPITIRTAKGSVDLDKGCIIADRHVHINTADKDKYGVNNGDLVKLHICGDKSGIMDAHIKISDDGYYEVHIDTDDASAFLLNTGDEVEMEVID